MSSRLKLSRREKSIALLVLAMALLGGLLPGRIIVSVSPSLTKRIFLLVSVPATIKDGDYLVFRHRDPEVMKFLQKGLDKDNDRLIKRVGCGPGDLLFREGDNFYCSVPATPGKERVYLGKALKKDSQGQELPQFNFQGFVPEDSYFMVGVNPRSYDSKYYGFIHAREFLYKALPLWPLW